MMTGAAEHPFDVAADLRAALGADRAVGLRPARRLADAGKDREAQGLAGADAGDREEALETAVRSWRTSRSIGSSSFRSSVAGGTAGRSAGVRRENAAARTSRWRSWRERCPRRRAG
jgi:hypothetical protein